MLWNKTHTQNTNQCRNTLGSQRKASDSLLSSLGAWDGKQSWRRCWKSLGWELHRWEMITQNGRTKKHSVTTMHLKVTLRGRRIFPEAADHTSSGFFLRSFPGSTASGISSFGLDHFRGHFWCWHSKSWVFQKDFYEDIIYILTSSRGTLKI